MRRLPLRRALGALLALAIVAGAPGSQAYQACAQTIGGSAAEAGSSARVIPSLGMTGLGSPTATLSLSALSLSPSVLSAPAAAPEVRTAPVAALAVAVHEAVAVSAVPAGPAQVAAAQAPLSYAAKTGPPVAAAPSGLL
ncbi:MAG: hypothetical protein ABL955_16635, partial [Elusimicrobiota bacterium]